MSAATTVVSLVSTAMGGGGLVAIVNALRKRRVDRADVTTKLADAWTRTVDQLQEQLSEAKQEVAETRREAAEARREAAEARREANGARQESERARREGTELADELARLRHLIHDPYMDLGRLRAMVPAPGHNGLGT